MAFPAEILRSSIKIADSLMKGVQSGSPESIGDVTIERWTGQTVHGDDDYNETIIVSAVIDRTNKVINRGDEQITIGATLTVVGDIPPNGTPGRREPIDPRDRITLPDGFTGPVISAPNSVVDPGTGRGFINEILLGMG